MSDDIVEWLRIFAGPDPDAAPCHEAADEIMRLRALTAEQALVWDAWLTERDLADRLAAHLEWALRCVGSLPMALRVTFDARMAEVLARWQEARRG